ncbi:hypothetical protein K501DRAFT_283650 [Backusella circina FSU 941]|nr:hypothetical protein K501DRAFT_283650 [Backusella circina FSU 941]
MSSSQVLIPKDPPSYDSLYQSIPSSQSSYLTVEQNSACSRMSMAIQRFIRRNTHFLQCLTAAATVSSTVMLLLWQLQNLASPHNPDDPWFDLEEY